MEMAAGPAPRRVCRPALAFMTILAIVMGVVIVLFLAPVNMNLEIVPRTSRYRSTPAAL